MELDKNHSVFFMHPSFCQSKEEYREICRKGRENDRKRSQWKINPNAIEKDIGTAINKPVLLPNGKQVGKIIEFVKTLKEKPADEDIYKNIKELDKE